MFSACFLSSVVLCCHSGETRSPKETEVFEVPRNPMSHQERLANFGISVRGAILVANFGKAITPHGAEVTIVYLDSPAMRAGLQVGDVILEANGRDVNRWRGPFNEVEVIGEALEDITRGKSLKLLVSRGADCGSPTETLTIRLLDMKRP